MAGNIIIALQVVFISILTVYFIFTLFSLILLLKTKNENTLGVEQETWQHGDKELTILFKKENRPAQDIIDGIKNNISQYEAMVMAFIDETGQFIEYKNKGVVLEGFSFPVSGFENNDFDFSIDYVDSKDPDCFLVAYFKDGKVKNVSIGD